MQGHVDRLDIRSCGYGTMAVIELKIALLRPFGLENSKTCLRLALAYISELSMYSALGIAMIERL